jgi:23S rRNA maturation mini-RNase III
VKGTIYKIASQAETITDYWPKFTDAEKELVRPPENHYTGLAAKNPVYSGGSVVVIY